MRYSFYKIVIFIFQLVIIALLTILCVHLGAFDFLCDIDGMHYAKTFFSNSYVVSVICSIGSVFILYVVQVKYGKYKIKKDFRCNEVISDLYSAIKDTSELIELTKAIEENVDKNSEAQEYYSFYIGNERRIDMCGSMLTYENHNILIESVQSVFFINLNFELLNIVNNIKNRKPDLTKAPAEIKKLCSTYQNSNEKIDLERCGHRIRTYLVDLRFMAKYYMNLLEYLEYDPLPTEMYIQAFRKRYPSNQEFLCYLELPVNERTKIEKEVAKEIRHSIISYKIKTFFRREK